MHKLKQSFNQLKRIRILFLSGILLFNFPAIAQDKDDQLNKGQFQGLVKFGVSTSQIFGDGYGGYNKAGLFLGTGVQTKLNTNLKLQLEIDYCNRGSRDPAKPDKGKYTSYKFSTHYIDVPVILKFWIWKFEFETGLNNGFFIFHREADQNGLIDPTTYKVQFTKYELALNAGVNVPINDKWYFNTRFQNSILPITTGWAQYQRGYGLAWGFMDNSIFFTFNRKLNQK